MSKARDQLPHVPAQAAIQSAYTVLNAVQHLTPGEQVAGVVVFFHHLSEQLGINPTELLDKARRWTQQADGMSFYRPEVKALRDYISGELR